MGRPKGSRNTPEQNARLRAAIKQALADPAVRARKSEAGKMAWADPVIRARMSEARKRVWADPDYRARMSAARTQARRGFAVPRWAEAAGLTDDFVAVARDRGEEAAASFCRALKRDMTA